MVSFVSCHFSFFLISISRTPEADSNNSSHHLPAILASTEAAKDFAHYAQQVNFKTQKESRHAKNVQSTRISLKKASRRKQIVKNVSRKNQLE